MWFNAIYSDLIPADCVVLQGSLLEPLGFVIYININDTNLFYTSKSVKNLNKLANRDMKHLNNWLSANKIYLNVEKTELVIFESPRKVILGETKIKVSGSKLYLSNSTKYLGIKIDRFLHWHYQVNNIAVKLDRTNVLFVLLVKIRNCLNMKTLRCVCFVIFDSHLSYSCIFMGSKYQCIREIDHSSEESTSNNGFQRLIISFKHFFIVK